MHSVTWNRFLIKNLLIDSTSWIQICTSPNYPKVMKADPSRLIPRKLAAKLELLIEWLLVKKFCSRFYMNNSVTREKQKKDTERKSYTSLWPIFCEHLIQAVRWRSRAHQSCAEMLKWRKPQHLVTSLCTPFFSLRRVAAGLEGLEAPWGFQQPLIVLLPPHHEHLVLWKYCLTLEILSILF